MSKNYKHLQNLPHSDTTIAIPISGLFTELSDRKAALSRIKTITTSESKLPIETKHKEASHRISTCLGYLSTISYRLTNPNQNLFMSLQLDWENLVIYSQVMLDSFSILTPIFYGISEKYTNKKGSQTVNSFNNLGEWFLFYKLNDSLTKRYKLIKKKSAWYKKLNVDRGDFIHGSKTPYVISKTVMQEIGFKVKKDKIFAMRDVKNNWVKPKTIEQETKTILQNLLDFLIFCNEIFVKKLEKRRVGISGGTQYKASLLGDFREFNKLVFKS